MKKSILLVTLLALTTVGVYAKSHHSYNLTSHLLSTPHFQLRSADIDSAPATLYTVRGLRQASGTASFAEFDTNKTSMPFSPALSLGLLVIVVTARALGVSRARGLADNEKAIYRGKSGMFRSLQSRA